MLLCSWRARPYFSEANLLDVRSVSGHVLILCEYKLLLFVISKMKIKFIALDIREYEHIVLVHYRDVSDREEVISLNKQYLFN